MTTLRAGKPLPDYDAVRQWQHTGCLAAAVPTVGEYLTGWLAGLHLDANTIRGYESHVRVHLIPHLGHLRLDQLVAENIRTMFVAIRQSAPQDAAQATATRPRPTGPGTCERIRATLRKALNDAVTDRLIPDNPVTYVRLPSAPQARPRLWTDERV
ncbi:MAG: integrase family protein, partial [Dactylosporangium sp.]|nr:integrase family protein [Dactylosporangium sp.]